MFEAMLREGDQYLDIGANIGMTALLAGHLIGKAGRGLAFEPNPTVFRRLDDHIKINHLTNITTHPVAIASERSVSRLVVAGGNTGLGTLAPSPEDDREGEGFEVTTMPGDVFADQLDSRKQTFIKVNVEGSKFNVLRGLSTILSWPEVALVAEISDEMLRNAGHSRAELHEILASHGFVPFDFGLEQQRWGRKLTIRRLDGPKDDPKYDALFAKPGSKFYSQKVEPLLVVS